MGARHENGRALPGLQSGAQAMTPAARQRLREIRLEMHTESAKAGDLRVMGESLLRQAATAMRRLRQLDRERRKLEGK
jgi:hypothetical protein